MMIYVAHKYSGDTANVERAKKITHDLQADDTDNCYICPLLAFGELQYGELGRVPEMDLCVDLLSVCDSLDSFITDRGWQEWMSEYVGDDGNADEIASILSAIWELKANPIKGIKKVCKLTNESIADEFCIPKRSIDNWSSGERESPGYVWMMMAYIAFAERGIV